MVYGAMRVCCWGEGMYVEESCSEKWPLNRHLYGEYSLTWWGGKGRVFLARGRSWAKSCVGGSIARKVYVTRV